MRAARGRTGNSGRGIPMRALPVMLMLQLALGAAPAAAQTTGSELPDIGTPASTTLSLADEYKIGLMIVRQLREAGQIVEDPEINEYLQSLGMRLASQAQEGAHRFTFFAVRDPGINAFALPGGFIGVNAGLVKATRSEAELAGVLAHEIAHVGLRHPTNQASKAYVAQAGIGIIGALLGSGDASTSTEIMKTVGGVGLNALFLRYSRKAETEADVSGTQIMARAGYDPMDMARFFQHLKTLAGREPSRLERFFSDHPSPGDRETRIRKVVTLLGVTRKTAPVGGLSSVQTSLKRLPAARSLQSVTR
jgi:predicted Zn-dependent protease